MAWYKEWFGEEYLELYAHRDNNEAERHIDFVEARFQNPAPGAVLDLACGAGRHTEVLRRRGYRCLGVDLSLTLLAQRPDLPRVRVDMRDLPFTRGSFDWVLNFFTSFGYFEEEKENFQVLSEIARLLKPGGRFLLDLMNPGPVLLALKAEESFSSPGREIEIRRWYDPRTRRINKRIRVVSPKLADRVFLESVRAYSAAEVSAALDQAGLRVDEIFGDFEGNLFSRDAERLIFVGALDG